MAKPKCESCGMRQVCRDSSLSWVLFFIGLIATIALRVIEPIRAISPLYAKLSWYIGVAGFFLFFIYKYRVLLKRSRIIKETGLAGKLASSEKLSEKEYRLLSEIVCSQDSWMERYNFFAIFILSALALAVALWFDFFG